ncbi:MAG: pilus assembly protein TadG-related protein [Deltaproteobacteria bacterium]|nr:pilus assembly protein TadG-related protein [Deltaproteobacteria bacterium]
MKKTGMHNRTAKKKRTPAFDESGAAALVSILVFTALCGFVGLALDVGHLVTAKSQLRRTADAAALTGAMGLLPYINPGPTQTPDWTQAQSRAHAIINNAANGVDNQTFTLTDGSVDSGYWALTPPEGYVQLPLSKVPLPAASLGEPAVTVTLSRNVTLYLAPLVGVSSPQTVTATATAILPEAYKTSGLPPVAVSWDTVYNSYGSTVQIDVVETDIKPQSNKGVAGWFNLNGGNDVQSVRINTPLTSSTDQVYLVPGTKATLTDFITQGETIVVPVIQEITQNTWGSIMGFAPFHVDSLGANSMTGHFVTQYFDPHVTPIAGAGSIGGVGGTPKLVGP